MDIHSIIDTQFDSNATNEKQHPLNIDKSLVIQAQRQSHIVARMQSMRILTTVPSPKIRFWVENLTCLPQRRGFFSRLLEQYTLVQDWSIIPRLLARAPRQDLVVLTGGERGELIYLALAGLCFWIRTPHLISDAHWEPKDGLLLRLQRILLRLGDRLTIQVQPHSAEEIDIYHRLFRIPRGKLHPVPWSTSLIGYNLNLRTGDFVLTGGFSYRDYPTFINAIKDLDIPVEFGLPANCHVPGTETIAKRPNITIHRTLTNHQFMDKMAGCRVFALPIVPGLRRSTGDRTILNAMCMRKVVIATDSIASRIYIKDGVNGILVPPGDAAAWREAILRVYAMTSAEYEAMAGQAEYAAKVDFNEELRMLRTLEGAFAALDARHASNTDASRS